jgi:uncharacterized protein YqeY
MRLIEQIGADFKAAYMESRTNEAAKEKKNFLGVLKTEVTKESKDPSDGYIISKIKSMIKSAEATESLSDMEMEVLEDYLPKQLSEAELTQIINDFTADNSGVNMGQIMGHLKKNYGGQYDGKIASGLAKSLS